MKLIIFATFHLVFSIPVAIAQPHQTARAGASSPSALAQLALARFAAGAPEDFAQVFPEEDGRELVSRAAYEHQERRAGIGRVVWRERHRAVLVLSGHVLTGNSGDETMNSRAFSGLYEATESKGVWRIARRLPLDAKNRILSHDLDVTVAPSQGLRVIDTIQIEVGAAYGFAVRLNHGAKLSDVRLDQKTILYDFGGGLLWLRAPRRPAEVRLTYSLDVEHDPEGANSGNFQSDFGQVRNQYFWHAFFDFSSLADHANFTVAVHIPSVYKVVTSVPQTDTVTGENRTVLGRSSKPTFAVTLLYDKDWQIVSNQFGRLQFETYLTPDFQPARAQLEKAFRHTCDLLRSRFGEPQAGYLGVAQTRARHGSGWHYRTNDVIVAGFNGGQLSSRGPRPRAFFGHEVSHGWTSPTGAATNFLMEGWATYAESLLLADEFGPEAERDFWESQRNKYFTGGFEGRSTVLNDPNNAGIAYSKGAWILRMLRDALGEAPFEKGMRDYMNIRPGQAAGLEEFLAAMTRASRRDVRRFLHLWLTESVIPKITTRVEGKRLLITQSGPVFELPLEIDLVTGTGTVRRTIQLRRREEQLDIGDVSAISEVRIDPDHRLLIWRARGEVIRLELGAPEAKKVEVDGDFTSKSVPATLSRGVWEVELPLTEGRYFWYWVIDGKRQQSSDGKEPRVKVQVIRPLEEISSPYPR